MMQVVNRALATILTLPVILERVPVKKKKKKDVEAVGESMWAITDDKDMELGHIPLYDISPSPSPPTPPPPTHTHNREIVASHDSWVACPKIFEIFGFVTKMISYECKQAYC